MNRNSLYVQELLGLELFTSENGEPKARLKITKAVCQPFGFLCGGISLAVAEILAGHSSLALCEPDEIPLGIQVSANHFSAVSMGGEITASASLLQKSRFLHVWNVDIVDEKGRLISSARVTNRIKARKTS